MVFVAVAISNVAESIELNVALILILGIELNVALILILGFLQKYKENREREQ